LAFQFVHVSTYSVKTGGAGIAAEAGRKPDNSRHIENPKPPVLLAGVQPENAWAEIERRHGAARDTITLKSGEPAQRKMRRDENVLLAAVASYPTPTKDLDPDDETFLDWKQRTLDFFKKTHGEPLSAVLHLDETHPHIHFLTAPDLEAGQRMKDIHPGFQAKAELGGRKAKATDKNRAWKVAMRGYQDDYHKDVSQHFAHLRLGPKRQRLSTAELKAQKAEAERVQQRLKALDVSEKTQRSEFHQAMSKVTAAQESVAREKSEITAKEKELKAAETKISRSIKKLNDRQSAITKTRKALSERQSQIAKRETQMAGLWGGLVSFVTLGRAGTQKRIRDAQKAAELDAQKKIEKITAKAEKTHKVLQNRVQGASEQRDALKRQKVSLEDKLLHAKGEIEIAEQNVEHLQSQLTPVKAENATLAKDLRAAKAFIGDLEKAAKTGDIDQLLKALRPEPEQLQDRDFDDDYGFRGPGL